jgi:hypothetical protein
MIVSAVVKLKSKSCKQLLHLFLSDEMRSNPRSARGEDAVMFDLELVQFEQQ